MADNKKPPAALLDDLASLDPCAAARVVAKESRKVAETFADVPPDRHTAHTLRLRAYLIDASTRQ